MTNLDEKYEQLKHYIENKGKNGVVIAFSGGLDSSVLVAICNMILGKKAVAVTAKSDLYTSEELEDAEEIAKKIGSKIVVVKTDVLSNENFTKNTKNRCYYCKKDLLERLEAVAHKLGLKAVFEGTNFSDLTGHRPGFVAVQELKNVYCPWVENKITKEEIRVLARKLNLSSLDKPANACLASRIAYNERITAEKLARIAKAERAIKHLTNVTQLRVRDHCNVARIEVSKDEIQLLSRESVLTKVVKELKELGFNHITIDLEGYRTGSMLQTLNNEGA